MADASSTLPPGAEATAVTVAIVPGVGGAAAKVYNVPLPPTWAQYTALLARVAALEAATAVTAPTSTPTPTPSPGTTPGADPAPSPVELTGSDGVILTGTDGLILTPGGN